jgi:hypothetical protein
MNAVSHCILATFPTAGWWKIRCSCGAVSRGPNEAAALEAYREHKSLERAS